MSTPVTHLSNTQLKIQYVRVTLTTRGNLAGIIFNGFLAAVVGFTIFGLGVAVFRHPSNKKKRLELKEELHKRGLPIPRIGMLDSVSAIWEGGVAAIMFREAKSRAYPGEDESVVPTVFDRIPTVQRIAATSSTLPARYSKYEVTLNGKQSPKFHTETVETPNARLHPGPPRSD